MHCYVTILINAGLCEIHEQSIPMTSRDRLSVGIYIYIYNKTLFIIKYECVYV